MKTTRTMTKMLGGALLSGGFALAGLAVAMGTAQASPLTNGPVPESPANNCQGLNCLVNDLGQLGSTGVNDIGLQGSGLVNDFGHLGSTGVNDIGLQGSGGVNDIGLQGSGLVNDIGQFGSGLATDLTHH
jgi:hypothetical protein